MDAATTVGNRITMPMPFPFGVFFPIAALPGWMQPVVAWLPLTPLLAARWAAARAGAGLTAIGGEVTELVAWLPVMPAVAAVPLWLTERRRSSLRWEHEHG